MRQDSNRSFSGLILPARMASATVLLIDASTDDERLFREELALVRDQPFVQLSAPECSVRIENRAGVLHPAEPRRRLQVRQLLVRKRSDEPREKLYDFRGTGE